VILGLLAVSAVAAVVLGLLLASGGGYDPHLLVWHKWMGIGLGVCCLATAVVYWVGWRKPYVGMLMVTLLMLGPAAHFGGSMTYGSDYLTEYAPGWVQRVMGEKPAAVAVLEVKPKVTELGQARVWGDVVEPVFQQNCVVCHGGEKQKGELRLDTLEGMKKGGKSGAALVAGKADGSLLVERIELPADDTKHMPPAGKPQLSEDQMGLIRWWVESGASGEKRVAEMSTPPVAVMNAIAKELGVPVPGSVVVTPAKYEEIVGEVAKAEEQTGVVITRMAQDSPMLNVNGATARKYGDKELAALEPLAKNISWLNLAGTQVTDSGLKVVGEMGNLERLRLERTGITDAGLGALSKLKKLDYLNLYGTAVTDAGLKKLMGLPGLEKLYVWKTGVTPEGAKEFAEGRVDKGKIARLKKQIASIERQIEAQHVEVVEGMATSRPATKPSTKPAGMGEKQAAVVKKG
jgi:hypothetical protein